MFYLRLIVCWAVLLSAGFAQGADRRPNILFIMSDDHASQAIGAYGGRLAELDPTPNIDALAKAGMRFDAVFCHNSICTPSRATILTGQYSQANGVLDLNGHLTADKQTLPLQMKQAGYHTAMIGKWHLKKEPASFDYYCVLPGQGQYFDPVFCLRGDKPWPANTVKKVGSHSSDAITDFSTEWLSEHWDRERPFFLMHHFKAPHDMFQNAPRYDEYLADVTIKEPANLRTPPPSGLGSGLTKGHEPWRLGHKLGVDQSLEEPAYSAAVYQAYLKRYLRCVKGVDDNVKRLIDQLREMGELDNTLIIYTADQGFFLGEHDLMDKRWMYEESMRMPFVVHWPDVVAAGSTNDWLINNTDFAPTLLDAAGGETPPTMQGRSFAAALKGESKPDDWRSATYYRYWMHMAHRLATPAHFGLRTERYKLIFFYGANYTGQGRTPAGWEFYDLKTDPHEMHNEYLNPEYADVIAELKTQLKTTREELAETDDQYPAIQKIINEHW
jgi:arylsulfatase A-like enzyme